MDPTLEVRREDFNAACEALLIAAMSCRDADTKRPVKISADMDAVFGLALAVLEQITGHDVVVPYANGDAFVCVTLPE